MMTVASGMVTLSADGQWVGCLDGQWS